MVTSLAEVWIEIILTDEESERQQDVTSLAEVWIEIGDGCDNTKYMIVTSLAEVWIEITQAKHGTTHVSHFPRGSVD